MPISVLSKGTDQQDGRVSGPRRLGLLLLAAPLLLTTACGQGQLFGPPIPPAKIISSVPDKKQGVEPNTKISVGVKDGKLTQVSLATKEGQAVAGKLAANGQSWNVTEPLDLGEDYVIEARAVDVEGKQQSVSKTSFSTVDAKTKLRYTMFPSAGQTVGVGQPIEVRFKSKVVEKAKIAKALKVTTSPTEVTGAWRWLDSKTLRWRPKEYWPASTKVTVAFNLRSVQAAPGLYGDKDASKSFKIAERSLVMKVDLRDNYQMSVYRDGKLLRRLAASGGKRNFETRSGVKIILGKQADKKMRSESIGISNPEAQDYYNTDVKWAQRITWSGEFIHGAPWNRQLGSGNGSHGCTNLSDSSAGWLYNQTMIGDPVEYEGDKPSKKMTLENGYGDWNLSWEQWVSGSDE